MLLTEGLLCKQPEPGKATHSSLGVLPLFLQKMHPELPQESATVPHLQRASASQRYHRVRRILRAYAIDYIHKGGLACT